MFFLAISEQICMNTMSICLFSSEKYASYKVEQFSFVYIFTNSYSISLVFQMFLYFHRILRPNMPQYNSQYSVDYKHFVTRIIYSSQQFLRESLYMFIWILIVQYLTNIYISFSHSVILWPATCVMLVSSNKTQTIDC